MRGRFRCRVGCRAIERFVHYKNHYPYGESPQTVFMCVCVCVCVCVRVYVVYEDTNLYNNMGMTEVLQFEGVL